MANGRYPRQNKRLAGLKLSDTESADLSIEETKEQEKKDVLADLDNATQQRELARSLTTKRKITKT